MSEVTLTDINQSRRAFSGSIPEIVDSFPQLKGGLDMETNLSINGFDSSGRIRITSDSSPMQQMANRLKGAYESVLVQGRFLMHEVSTDMYDFRQISTGKALVKACIVGEEVFRHFASSNYMDAWVVEMRGDMFAGYLGSYRSSADKVSFIEFRGLDRAELEAFQAMTGNQSMQYVTRTCEMPLKDAEEMQNQLRLRFAQPQELPDANADHEIRHILHKEQLGAAGDNVKKLIGIDVWCKLIDKINSTIPASERQAHQYNALSVFCDIADLLFVEKYEDRLNAAVMASRLALLAIREEQPELFSDETVIQQIAARTKGITLDNAGIPASLSKNIAYAGSVYNNGDLNIPHLINAKFLETVLLPEPRTKSELLAFDANTGLRAYRMFGNFILTVAPSRIMKPYYWQRVDMLNQEDSDRLVSLRDSRGKQIIAN
jgi:hypothetical protein